VLGLFAYYANVREEIAVEERDELPRVARDLRFREDYINPCVMMMSALLLCFAPVILLLFLHMPTARLLQAGAIFALIGAYPFPAVFLTLTTSGAIANMHPRRVRAIMHVCGSKKYLLSVLLFIAGAAPYAFGVMGLCVGTMFTADIDCGGFDWMGSFYVWIPSLCLGIILLHVFAWHLALIYRTHAGAFPWVGREALDGPELLPRTRGPVARRKPKYVEPADPIEM
jgi:hypothetical protein